MPPGPAERASTPGRGRADTPLAPLVSIASTLRRDPRLLLLLLLFLILAAAAVVRLYRLPELTFFGGDEAHHAGVVRSMLLDGRPALLGPGSSVGGFSRGPAYYYLLLPAFWLGAGDPAAGAIFVALADIVTVSLLFLVGRSVSGPATGLVAAALWAASSLTIGFARFMWNPQLVPLFELLVIYALVRLRSDDRFLLLLVPAWVMAWQLHDQALLLVPSIFVALAWQRPRIRPRWAAAAVLLGGLVLAPFLVYEAGHGFENIRAMIDVALRRGGASPNAGLGPLDRLAAVWQSLDGLLPAPEPFRAGLILLVVAGVVVAVIRAPRDPRAAVLLVWALAVVPYAFWPGRPSPQYVIILYALPFLAIGLTFDALWRWRPSVAAVGGIALAIVCLGNLASVLAGIAGAELRSGSLATMKAVAATIAEGASGRPFAVRLLSRSEGLDAYAEPYRYLLELQGAPPERRVDLPTWLVVDPADFADGAALGGTDVHGVRVVAEGAPAVGSDIVANGSFGGPSGGPPDGWVVPTWGRADLVDGPEGRYLALDSPEVSDGFDARQAVPVTAAARYLVRFQVRSLLQAGAARVVVQVRDASGAAVATFPDGAGYPIPPGPGWLTGAFFVDVPSSGHDFALLLRNQGVGEVDVRSVEVRPVLSSPVPGQPVY